MSAAAPMRTGSLRRRLALTCLGILCLAFAGFDLFLYTSVDARLTGELNAQLVDRAGLARLLGSELSAQQLADRLTGAGVSATVRHDGTVTVGRPRPPAAGAAPAGRPPSPPAPPRGTPTDVVRHGRTLSLTETLPDGTLVLRTDRGPVDAELHRLLILEVLGSLGVVLLAALGLALLIGRALAPLERMTRVAAGIAAGRGGQRLRPDRTDTELGRMAGAFDSMLDSLEEATGSARRSEERMRAFLADISHELRTPVTGFVASAETLLRDGAVRDPEHERRLVAMIRESGRAARLIDDLLTLGELERGGTLRRRPVDLAALAREQADRTQLLAPGLTITLRGEDRPLVPGDPDRLAQVIANLLDNARHATPEDGAIAIELTTIEDRARLTVTDTGRGVPPDARERIFDRLVRLDPSRSRARFGGGLGLPIARTIARAHEGDVRCVAREGGARFELTLPCPRPDPDAEAPLKPEVAFRSSSAADASLGSMSPSQNGAST